MVPQIDRWTFYSFWLKYTSLQLLCLLCRRRTIRTCLRELDAVPTMRPCAATSSALPTKQLTGVKKQSRLYRLSTRGSWSCSASLARSALIRCSISSSFPYCSIFMFCCCWWISSDSFSILGKRLKGFFFVKFCKKWTHRRKKRFCSEFLCGWGSIKEVSRAGMNNNRMGRRTV